MRSLRFQTGLQGFTGSLGVGGTPRGLNLRLGLKMVQSLYCRPSTNIDPPAAMWRGGMHLTLAVVKGDVSDHKSTTVRN